uniref:Uncharacterized protein n=1 Tax=Alexandrium monilatum TaxID=311494 RepID=A0A7S4PT04_9DINO
MLGVISRGKGGPRGKGFGKGEGKGLRGDREVNLSGRQFDDVQLSVWCERWQVGTPPIGLVSLNLSNNELGNAGAATLVNLLMDLGPPIRVIKLFSNRVADDGALALAKYVKESHTHLAELHLSHNAITRHGAEALLMASAKASDKAGGPRYPSFETVGQCRPVPLWLRLEYNLIDEGGQFHIAMEKRLLAERRQLGFLPEAGPAAPMICEAVEGYGCSSHSCAMLCPGGLGGTPGGPVVHAPHLRKQRHPADLPGGHGLVARAGSRPMLALPAPGDEPSAGVLKPPAILPRARSPVRFFIGEEEEAAERKAEQAIVKPCRYVDVRLGDGGPTAAGADAPKPAAAAATAVPAVAAGGATTAPAAAAREATPDPRPQQAKKSTAPPPKVGQTLRVVRQVTASDAIKAGYAPDNYLQPLQPGDEVLVTHVCEGEEAGWIGAQRSRGGQGEGPGGWLSLDALTTVPAVGAHGGS